MARKEYQAACRILEDAISRSPEDAWLWVVFSHALLQEGKNWDRAEEALRMVLKLDPGNGEARTNLAVLTQQQRKIALC